VTANLSTKYPPSGHPFGVYVGISRLRRVTPEPLSSDYCFQVQVTLENDLILKLIIFLSFCLWENIFGLQTKDEERPSSRSVFWLLSLSLRFGVPRKRREQAMMMSRFGVPDQGTEHESNGWCSRTRHRTRKQWLVFQNKASSGWCSRSRQVLVGVPDQVMTVMRENDKENCALSELETESKSVSSLSCFYRSPFPFPFPCPFPFPFPCPCPFPFPFPCPFPFPFPFPFGTQTKQNMYKKKIFHANSQPNFLTVVTRHWSQTKFFPVLNAFVSLLLFSKKVLFCFSPLCCAHRVLWLSFRFESLD